MKRAPLRGRNTVIVGRQGGKVDFLPYQPYYIVALDGFYCTEKASLTYINLDIQETRQIGLEVLKTGLLLPERPLGWQGNCNISLKA